MKKRICLAVSAALISSCCIGYSVFSLEKPNIFVNGNQIETDAFIQDGVTYVPLRAVSESLGADVAWNDFFTASAGCNAAAELEALYKTAIHHKLKLLLIESTDRALLKHEKKLVIDNDLCEI